MKIIFCAIYLLCSFTSHSGIIEPNVVWNKSEIKTCFLNNFDQLKNTQLATKLINNEYKFENRVLTQNEKDYIRFVVLSEFTSTKTNAFFYGFEDCRQNDNSDIIILGAKPINFITPIKINGFATLGERGAKKRISLSDGSYNYIYEKKENIRNILSLYKTDPSTIVHEFGHALGLAHEHIHPESKSDIRCLRSNITGIQTNNETLLSSTQIYTEYDNKSVMNYCYSTWNRGSFVNKVGSILSPKDKATLKAFY
jgi:hypothetical protein